MELQHRFTVPASVDETWALFNDLEQVAPCFPGAALTSAEGDSFAGTVKVKLGPVSLQYSGTGTFVERDEGSHTARIEAKGKDKRGNGTAAAKVRTVLIAEGSGTAVEVSTDLSVTGKPAQFGRGLMQDVSDKLLARFVACLSDKLVGEPAPAAADEPAAEPAAKKAPAPAAKKAAKPAAKKAAGPAAKKAAEPAATPAGGAEPAQPRAAKPRTAPPPRDDSEAMALDLGATVLPVLAKRYGPPALGALLVLLVLRWLIRR